MSIHQPSECALWARLAVLFLSFQLLFCSRDEYATTSWKVTSMGSFPEQTLRLYRVCRVHGLSCTEVARDVIEYQVFESLDCLVFARSGSSGLELFGASGLRPPARLINTGSENWTLSRDGLSAPEFFRVSSGQVYRVRYTYRPDALCKGQHLSRLQATTVLLPVRADDKDPASGRTWLHAAIAVCDVPAAMTLLQTAIPQSKALSDDPSLLPDAIKCKDRPLLLRLLQLNVSARGADDAGYGPLTCAVETNDSPLMSALVSSDLTFSSSDFNMARARAEQFAPTLLSLLEQARHD